MGKPEETGRNESLVWSSVALLVIGGLVLIRFESADAIRRLGLVFEIIGLVSVMLQVWDAERRHRIESLWKRLAAYLSNAALLFRAPPRHINMEAESGSFQLKGSDAKFEQGNVTPMDELGRILLLEQRVSALHEQLSQANKRIAAEAKSAMDAIDDLKSKLADAAKQTSDAIKGIETDHLGVTKFGLFWLLAGLILTTATPEIECFLRRFVW